MTSLVVLALGARGGAWVMRTVVAFFGHAPALWLVYREPLPVSLRAPNVVAVVVTLVAMAIAGFVHSGFASFLAWIVGHVLWGTYLAARLPPPATTTTGGAP